MLTRAEEFQRLHRVTLAAVRLFASGGWQLGQGRAIEADLHGLLSVIAATAGPCRLAARGLLGLLARTDYFDPDIAVDRARLLEAVLSLREHLLMSVSAEHRQWAGSSWGDLEHDLQAGDADAHTNYFSGVLGQALGRLTREHSALDKHAIVSVADRTGKILDANAQFCGMSGYSREELIGSNHRILKSGRHPDSFYTQMWTTILQGQVWQGEVCNRRKDGGYYWVKSTIVPILNDEGRVEEFVSIRTDISALKATEERLELFQRAVHASTTGIFMADALGEGTPLTYVSPSICSLTGYAEDALRGRGIRMLLGDAVDVEPARSIAHAIASGEPVETLLKSRRPDGHAFSADLRLSPVRSDLGVLTHFVGVVTDVTELEKTRQELHDREERLRRSQAYANIGTWDWDIRTGELFWSDRIAPLFGHAPGALQTTYENFLAAVHPDDRQAVVDAVATCLASGAPYELEHRCIWPDGSIHWLLERGDVTRDEHGGASRMLGVVQDVTDRKEAEDGLRRSQARLTEAQRLSRIGDWTADLSTGEVDWSPVVYEIFGRTPATFRPCFDAFRAAAHPGDVAMVDEAIDRVVRGGGYELIYRIVISTGEVRWVQQRANAAFDDSGRVVALSGTSQDVTERVQLQEHSHLLRRVVDTTEQAIGIADHDGRLLFVNPAYKHLLGYRDEDCLATRLVDHFSPSVIDDVRRAMARCNGSFSWRGELPMSRRDGSEVVTMGNLGVVSDPQGDVRHYFHIFSDYSDELHRQDELRHAKEKAERANEAKSAFLSSMSHELRTPMNAVLGFAQLLEMRGELSATNTEYVRHILKAGKHLLELIGEVLDLARVEAGRISISLESVDIAELLQDTVALLQPVARRAAVELTLEPGAGLTVRADRVRLKQVITNLLSNAIKYNRPRGTVTVGVRPLSDPDRVSMSIADTGAGLSRRQMLHLFEPFNRLGAEARGVEGTGIGLTISKRLVELMNGSISVESSEGIGSTFSVVLPAAQATTREAPDAAFAALTRPAEEFTPSDLRTVLHVEDNPANLALVQEILRDRQDINLLSAHAPLLGIELARAHLPDLILLDINLPDLDGFQVMAMLRQDASTASIPVIAVTADVTQGCRRRIENASFFGLIEKPVSVMETMRLVEAALREPRVE